VLEQVQHLALSLLQAVEMEELSIAVEWQAHLVVVAAQVVVGLREVLVILLLQPQAKEIKVETLGQLLCPEEQMAQVEAVERVQQGLMHHPINKQAAMEVLEHRLRFQVQLFTMLEAVEAVVVAQVVVERAVQAAVETVQTMILRDQLAVLTLEAVEAVEDMRHLEVLVQPAALVSLSSHGRYKQTQQAYSHIARLEYSLSPQVSQASTIW
jgi:hypothetical protein